MKEVQINDDNYSVPAEGSIQLLGMKKVLIHERLSPDVLFASSLYDNDNRIVGTRIAFDRQEIHLVNKKSFFRNRTVDCDFLIIES
jgi:hypothetical protein